MWILPILIAVQDLPTREVVLPHISLLHAFLFLRELHPCMMCIRFVYLVFTHLLYRQIELGSSR